MLKIDLKKVLAEFGENLGLELAFCEKLRFPDFFMVAATQPRGETIKPAGM